MINYHVQVIRENNGWKMGWNNKETEQFKYIVKWKDIDLPEFIVEKQESIKELAWNKLQKYLEEQLKENKMPSKPKTFGMQSNLLKIQVKPSLVEKLSKLWGAVIENA